MRYGGIWGGELNHSLKKTYRYMYYIYIYYMHIYIYMHIHDICMLVPRKGKFAILWLIQWEGELFVLLYSLAPAHITNQPVFQFSGPPQKGGTGHQAHDSFTIKRWFTTKMDQRSHKNWRQTGEENHPVLMRSKLPTKNAPQSVDLRSRKLTWQWHLQIVDFPSPCWFSGVMQVKEKLYAATN